MGAQGKTVEIDLDEDTSEGKAQVADTIVDEDKGTAVTAPESDIVDEDFDPDDRLPPQAIRNEDGSVTLPLKFPKSVLSKRDGKVRERQFPELTLHRLNGADRRAIGAASDGMQDVVALSRATRLNQAVMNALYDRMDAADIQAAAQVLVHFFASGRKTGR